MNRKISALFLLLFTFSQVDAFCPVGGFWVPSAEVDGKVGSYRNGAGITLFSPVCQDDNSLVFWQTNFGNYRKVWTGSLGLGYRRLATSWAAWGVNGFADVSYSEASRTYGQLGFGGELLGRCWEARLNGYIPTTRRTCVNSESFGVDPFVEPETRRVFSHITDYRLCERSYKGFDAEAGYGVKLWRGQLWGYGGYYGFYDRGIHPVQGPRVRVEYHLFNLFRTQGTRVVLAGEWGYDSLHKNQGLFYASLRVPLCGFKKGCALDIRACEIPTLCQRMNNRVIREPGIWVDRAYENGYRVDLIPSEFTQGARHLYFVSSEGEGDGSLENPLSFADMLKKGGTEDVLFLLGDFKIDKSLEVKLGQTLVGYGQQSEELFDFGPYGVLKVTADETLSKARVIGHNKLGKMITMGHHSSIRNLDIDAGGAKHAIYAEGTKNLRIANVTIAHTSGDAIVLENTPNPTLHTATLHNIEGDAVKLGVTNGVIRNLTLNGVKGNGVRIHESHGVLVDDVKLTEAQGNAVKTDKSDRVTLRRIGIKEKGKDAKSEATYLPASIVLDGVTHYAIHDSCLFAEKGETLLIKDCAGLGFIKNTKLAGKGNTVLSINGGQADLKFAGECELNAKGGTALNIYEPGGKIDAQALATTASGIANGPFVSVTQARGVHLGPTTLKPVGGASVCVALNSSDATFDKLTVVNKKGGGVFAQDGTLNVRHGEIVATDGIALQLLQMKGTLQLDKLESKNSPSQGLYLNKFDGTLDITQGDITKAAEGAIAFDGGKGTLVYRGPIKNGSGPLLKVNNLDKEGSVTLYGWYNKPQLDGNNQETGKTEKVRGVETLGGEGVVISKSKGAVTVIGTRLTTHDRPAYLATDSIGALKLTESELEASGSARSVVNVTNPADFFMKDCTLTVGEGSLEHAVTIGINSELPKLPVPQDEGEPLLEAPSPQQITIQDNTFKHGDRVSGSVVDVQINGSPGKTELHVIGNRIDEGASGYTFGTAGSQGKLELMFRDNWREKEAPIKVSLNQGGEVPFHSPVINQKRLMQHNPKLLGGDLYKEGNIQYLWEPPKPPQEKSDIISLPGLKLDPTKSTAK